MQAQSLTAIENCVLLESTQRGWMTGYSPPYGYSLDSGNLRGSDTTCSFKYPFVCGAEQATTSPSRPAASAPEHRSTQWLTLAEVEVLQSDSGNACLECHGLVHIAVDSYYTMWVNGAEIGSSSPWSHTATHSFYAPCDGSTLFAIAGISRMSKPSMLLEIVHCGEVVRSDTAWSCATGDTGQTGQGTAPAWTQLGFNETLDWCTPVDGGANGVPPWGPRDNISPHARWIWAAGNLVRSDVMCRLTQPHAVPDCAAAREQYRTDYAALRHTGVPEWSHFINYGRHAGLLWHGELCKQQCGGEFVVAVEGAGAFLEQRVQQLHPYAKYRVKILAAAGRSPARSQSGDPQFPTVIAMVDGVRIWSSSSLTNQFRAFYMQFMTVGTTMVTLRFENTSPEHRADHHIVPMSAIFLDEIQINQIEVYSPVGDACTTRTGHCASAPCLHSALGCVEEVNTYVCSCAAGWTGDNCGEDANECASNPCLNGASCNDAIGSYHCSCISSGYAGENCALEIDPCHSSPCLHGGVCTETSGFGHPVSCTCAQGYDGVNCQNNVNDCMGAPCGHGVCIDLLGSFACQCLAGYTGNNCTSMVGTECDTYTRSQCDSQGHATCTQTGPSTHDCRCDYGYAAIHDMCERVDLCLSAPCQHGTHTALAYRECSRDLLPRINPELCRFVVFSRGWVLFVCVPRGLQR